MGCKKEACRLLHAIPPFVRCKKPCSSCLQIKALDTNGIFTWADVARTVQIFGYNVVTETQA